MNSTVSYREDLVSQGASMRSQLRMQHVPVCTQILCGHQALSGSLCLAACATEHRTLQVQRLTLIHKDLRCTHRWIPRLDKPWQSLHFVLQEGHNLASSMFAAKPAHFCECAYPQIFCGARAAPLPQLPLQFLSAPHASHEACAQS